jgi:hypothetical protein
MRVVQVEQVRRNHPVGLADRLAGVETGVELLIGLVNINAVKCGIVVVLAQFIVGLPKHQVCSLEFQRCNAGRRRCLLALLTESESGGTKQQSDR